jgi:D-hydroxyproline dehydrogenase subunit beta
MTQRMFDLIVIGSGILGTFHAYHALKAGKKVLIIEKDKRPQEATVRNFGQIVPSGLPVGEWNQYGRISTEIYKEIQKESDISIRNNGSVYIASGKDELTVLEEMQQRFSADDYACEIMAADKVLERYPSIQQDYVAGALFFPTEVSAEPEKMIHQLHLYLVNKFEEAVVFQYHNPVISAQVIGDNARIRTASGEVFSAEHCIICNGRDVKVLFPEVFAKSGLIVSKLNMMATLPQPQIKLHGNILTGLSIRRYESFQSCDTYQLLNAESIDPDLKKFGIHILFKQRVDGSIIIGDSHEYAPVMDQDDLSIYYNNMEINKLMIREAKKIIRLDSWDMAQCWTGFYAQHNELEIFEKTIDGRIHIASGIGGKGMTTSPGYAKANLKRLGIV